MKKIEMKPCPFCGCNWHEKEGGVFILWHDPTCVFGGPNGVVHSTTGDDLFAIKWNTRAADIHTQHRNHN